MTCDIFTGEDETAKPQLSTASHFPHLTICLSRPLSSSVPSTSTYLHALFSFLSTDTAIINHGKEHSRSRLLAAVGKASCLPASFAQLDHRIKQRFHTDPRTARSKEQARAATADFLRLFSLVFSNPTNQPALSGQPGRRPAIMSGL